MGAAMDTLSDITEGGAAGAEPVAVPETAWDFQCQLKVKRSLGMRKYAPSYRMAQGASSCKKCREEPPA